MLNSYPVAGAENGSNADGNIVMPCDSPEKMQPLSGARSIGDGIWLSLSEQPARAHVSAPSLSIHATFLLFGHSAQYPLMDWLPATYLSVPLPPLGRHWLSAPNDSR